MASPRYFQDELDYLRKSGREFARFYPRLTDYLSERSTDPDVERLLEGFAFLTSKLREKIDDQLPEVTQSLLMLLWPNFLRPVPSMVMMQMEPIPGAINERHVLGAGAEIESTPVEGTVCRFRSSYDTEILPINVTDVRHDVSRQKSVVTIRIETLNQEPIAAIDLKDIRFYLAGSDYSALTNALWLHRYLKNVHVRNAASGEQIKMPPKSVERVGMDSDHSVLPYPKNSFPGYRLLQEYYAFPEKYYFFEVKKVPLVHFGVEDIALELVFEFERPLPPDVRIESTSFLLHCVPAINLFEHDSEPVLLDARRTEYKVLPSRRDAGEIEIFTIDTVTGWLPNHDAKSGGISREFSRFESFQHEIERVDGRSAVYFREKVRQSMSGQELDRLISFMREDEVYQITEGETVSIGLTCSNGSAPVELAVGDVSVPTHSVPSYITPTNITRPTEPRYPVVDGTLQWQLISALSLNYLSLQSTDAIRTILNIYDFNAKVSRQRERAAELRMEGIQQIQSKTVDRFFKGLPIRGMQTSMHMQESKFASEGEMYLFASVLSEFFALYATVNSFHELVVHGIEAGEVYQWTARVGNQTLI